MIIASIKVGIILTQAAKTLFALVEMKSRSQDRRSLGAMLKGVTTMPNELKPCPWCRNKNGKIDLQFSVIDDDFAQYVKTSMIKFCPFCGRSLKEGADNA